MTILPLKSDYLKFLKEDNKDKKKYKEKIMGAGYFTILQEKANKFHNHDVIVDHDNFMDVYHAIKIARRVGAANDYNFNFSTTRSTYNNFIRISDYIAALRRNVRGNWLNNLDHLKILPDKIPQKYLERAFSGK